MIDLEINFNFHITKIEQLADIKLCFLADCSNSSTFALAFDHCFCNG